jgi:hypothetical protein
LSALGEPKPSIIRSFLRYGGMWREVRPLRELWVTDTPRDIIDAMVTGQSAINAGTDLPAPTAFRPPRARHRGQAKAEG